MLFFPWVVYVVRSSPLAQTLAFFYCITPKSGVVSVIACYAENSKRYGSAFYSYNYLLILVAAYVAHAYGAGQHGAGLDNK